jgi:hypothetical protein
MQLGKLGKNTIFCIVDQFPADKETAYFVLSNSFRTAYGT